MMLVASEETAASKDVTVSTPDRRNYASFSSNIFTAHGNLQVAS